MKMKKTTHHIYIFVLFILLLSTIGCKKFLEEQSQSEIRPSTIQDLVALMTGEGYPYRTAMFPALNLLTDDIQSNVGPGLESFRAVAIKGKSAFGWSPTMFEDLTLSTGLINSTAVNIWQTLYTKIAGCNTVLANINKVIGSDNVKQHLKGEALCMRAYYYFMLVNFFGKPYNAPGVNPESSLGVPLKLNMEVTDSLFSRNSVAAVYRQMETDLKEGALLMENNVQNQTLYKFTPWAAYAMLSRLYLYQEKWDEAIVYADKVITVKPTLTNLNTYKQRAPGGYYMYNNGVVDNANRIYDPVLSKEILWMYRPVGIGTGGSSDEVFPTVISPGYDNNNNPPYSVSDALLGLYESAPMTDTAIYLGDLRSRIYVNTSLYFASFFPTITYGFKFIPGSNGVGGSGIRTSEVYLNRAEAKIQKFIATGNATLRDEALQDLNKLRTHRYDIRKAYELVNITNGATLLTFCRNERRREFPFDGEHRWFDLRRYGMPELIHQYAETAGSGETFTLPQGSNRYTLPIPKVVLERNAKLAPNP